MNLLSAAKASSRRLSRTDSLEAHKPSNLPSRHEQTFVALRPGSRLPRLLARRGKLITMKMDSGGSSWLRDLARACAPTLIMSGALQNLSQLASGESPLLSVEFHGFVSYFI